MELKNSVQNSTAIWLSDSGQASTLPLGKNDSSIPDVEQSTIALEAPEAKNPYIKPEVQFQQNSALQTIPELETFGNNKTATEPGLTNTDNVISGSEQDVINYSFPSTQSEVLEQLYTLKTNKSRPH